jgi:hypothetical protein
MDAAMDARGLETLLAVVVIAALAPVIVAVLPGPKIPEPAEASPSARRR